MGTAVNTWTIHNVNVMEPGVGVIGHSLRVAEGRIDQVDPVSIGPGEQRIDGGGRLLTPGLVDIHVHGIHQWVFELGPEHIRDSSRVFGRYGTTCVLPTLYRVMVRDKLKHLESLARSLDGITDVSFPGWHLEGPFLALPGIGSDTIPGDLGLLDEVLAAAGIGRTLAMSISPDTPHILPVIERLREEGIAAFITHTKASAEQTEAALNAGARHATHFYNVFPAPEVTEPGVRPAGTLEAIYADRGCTVDFICDGVHVPTMTIRAAIAAKGFERVAAITDANIGAGLPPGEYQSAWGFPIRTSPETAARNIKPGDPGFGLLAGSVITMDQALNNLMKWFRGEMPEHQIWSLCTRNPAKVVGLDRKGTLRAGADADVVLWDCLNGSFTAQQTWVAGRSVYRRTQE